VTHLGFIPSWQFSQNPFQPAGLGFIPSWQLGAGPIDAANVVFDSFWWRNRKWLVLGGVTALGLGLVAILK
jgi:hypothetical protein